MSAPKSQLTDQGGDNRLSDVRLCDEIATAAKRCCGLFYATMELSRTGSDIAGLGIESISHVGVDEAEKIIGHIEQWHNQRDGEAV